MDESISTARDVRVNWFEKGYECSECGTAWTDEWSCECNDRCPTCDAETTPSRSIDLSRPVTEDDYRGAALLMGLSTKAPCEVSAENAKDYAEAMLEGGPHRFEPHSRQVPLHIANSADNTHLSS